MEFFRIRFSHEEDRAKALVALAKRARVVGLADHVYEVSRRSLEFLDESGYEYEIVAKEGFDGLVSTVRGTVAAQVQ